MAEVKRLKHVFSLEEMLRTATALRHVWFLCGLMAVYSLLALWKEASPYRDVADLPANLYAAFSMVMGLLLVFRTNRVYERWWEGRTLWGTLINTSRNLAVKVRTFIRPDPLERAEMLRLIAGFAVALKGHLRDGAMPAEIPGWESRPEKPRHVPALVASAIYERLAAWKRAGRLSDEEVRMLEREARSLLEICGGCERIRKTPIAGSYRSFTLKCLILYLATLPWGLVHEFSYWTVAATVVLTYLMVGLEAIAEALEEPFGHDIDDLDLDCYCRTIEESVAEILSEA